MGNYTSLNVLSNPKKLNDMSQDSIDQVAQMLKNTGANRSQRRRLERSLGKVDNIMRHTQERVDRSAFREYELMADDHMRRFFAILGIIMSKNYEKSEDEIEELYGVLNAYLTEYMDASTDDVCKVCEEVTGFTLVAG